MLPQGEPKLSRRIRRYRTEKRLTQTELGKAVGVKRIAVSRWENDQATPEGANLMRLEELLERTGESNAEEQGTVQQLLLPFDRPMVLELRMSPQKADSVQFQVRLKDVAS